MMSARAKMLGGVALLAVGLACAGDKPPRQAGQGGVPDTRDSGSSRTGGGGAGATGGTGAAGAERGGSAGASGAGASGNAGTSGGGSGGSGGAGKGGTADAAPAPDSAGTDASVDMNPMPSDASADRLDVSNPSGVTYVYTSGYNPQITIFSLDTATGILTPSGSVDATVSSPSYLAVSPNRQFLYAANEASGTNSKIVAFRINSTNGSLQKINEAPAGGDGSPHLSVHPSGKLVLVAHYGSGHVSTLLVDANGGVAMPPSDIQRPANSASHQVITDSTGSFAFVPNVNTVFQFRVDATTAKLTANGSVTGYPGAAGPRHLAFHPTSSWAYSINETALTVSTLTYDATAGTLANPVTVDSLPAGAARTGTGAHIIVHPSGRFVYASNRGHNSISIFDVHPTTGQLTMSGNETGAGEIRTPRDFGMDAAGKFLIVANQETASLVVFEINGADGKLTRRDTKTTPAQPTFVGIVQLP